MFKKICFYILLIFSFTSCFEVVEDVSFKKDGSGFFKLIVNLSQSKNEMKSLMKLDSSSGYKVPNENEMNAYLDQALINLKTTEGLSNVSIKRDFNNWIFELNTNFNNTKSLERGLQNMKNEFSEGKANIFINKLTFDGKILEREIQISDEETREQLNKATEKRILSKAKYTTIYRFESTIENVSNKKAKISPSRKAIMLQNNVLNLVNGIESLKNTVKLN